MAGRGKALSPEDKDKKIEKQIESELPEHIPVIPLDVEIERKKEEARKKAVELRKKQTKVEPIIITEDEQVKKVSELTFQEQEVEIIRCAVDPIYFIETYLTIFDQTQGVDGLIVPFKLFDYQKDLIESYLNNTSVITNKYRQGGISTVTCAFISWLISFNPNRTVAIVANKLETARDELMNDVVEFIKGCPEWLVPKTGKTLEKDYKDTQKLKRYDNGSSLGAFSAKGGLRGLTPNLIFWDETAHTDGGDKFWTAAKPTLSTGGKCYMVSCVTKDTFIYTNKGIKQIKDFIPNENPGAHIIDEYSVLGKDKLRNGNIFFNNGYVDTLKIKSTYSELESSYNHKYWAYKLKDNKYNWYKASELEIGDYISIQYGMNIFGNNDDCSDFEPTESVYIKNVFNPKKITTTIAYLLGLYISEGNAANIYNKNGKFSSFKFVLTCGDSLNHIFDENRLTYYQHNIQYSVTSKNLGEFLEYLGFDIKKKAKEKIIPSRLFEMSKENIIALIQGIMDGDGWANYSKKVNTLSVGIALSSKKLIDQLRILLGNFGILCRYNERIVKPTQKVKAYSHTYSIVCSGENAVKYFNEIGFRFQRKQNKIKEYNINKVRYFGGHSDVIPNGVEILNQIYSLYNIRGFLKSLKQNGFKIEPYVTENRYKDKPYNKKYLINFIDYLKESKNFDDEYLKNIINKNLIWTPIKSIEQSKNWTYDFSLPNDIIEENDFHHSVIYNQIITHNTPSGLDPVFYKTFMGAKAKENNFFAVELYWFNDPRYNQYLVWLKNKGKTNEIKLVDEGWSKEHRIKLMEDGWEASSPWFESQVRDANGDMRRIAQEILCISSTSLLSVYNTVDNKYETLTISELYNKLSEIHNPYLDVVLNDRYLISKTDTNNNQIINGIINSNDKDPIINPNNDIEYIIPNNYSRFLGISKSIKNIGYKIVLEYDNEIIVSEDHIFLANDKNMYVKSLVPNVTYITTNEGDFYVKSIEKIIDDENGIEFYDIIDSENCEYSANGFSNHNCSFLGSGDNFIAEEYLKRIEENEILVPIRQEYSDKNMWIWEDPKAGEDYIMSIDASPGHGDDNSTINIVKTVEIIEEKIIVKGEKSKKVKVSRHKVEQVAEYYGKITPQMLAEIAYQFGKYYNDAYTVIDITGGYGVQTVEKLLEIGYENIHYAEVSHKPSRDRLQGYVKKGQKMMSDGTIVTVDLIPGFFIGSNRASVLLELQRAIHLEDAIIRSVRLLNELKTFITVQGNRVADHKRSFHDDSIMGFSIGLYVLNYDMKRFKENKGVTEKMLNAMITNNDVKDYENQNKIKRPISLNSSSPLNPYIANAWLFKGLKKK